MSAYDTIVKGKAGHPDASYGPRDFNPWGADVISVPPEKALFWSVYIMDRDGTWEWIDDYDEESDARARAEKVSGN